MSTAQLFFALGVILLALRGHASGSLKTLDVFGCLFIIVAAIAAFVSLPTYK